MYIFNFSIPKSKYLWVRTRISLCLLSLDMHCDVFSCVVYSHLKAFRKIKLIEKLAILQYLIDKYFLSMKALVHVCLSVSGRRSVWRLPKDISNPRKNQVPHDGRTSESGK